MSTISTNTLYLVRHGENPANITKELSYKLIDYSLTAKGVLQAEQTADHFKAIPLDAIYASPLKRARETAEIIAVPQGLPITLLEEFREVNVGDLEKDAASDTSWAIFTQTVQGWFRGRPEVAFPGGENLLELIERSRQGLLAATRGRANQQILISAHGGICAAIVRNFCTNVKSDERFTPIHNCSITEIELTTSGEEVSGNLRSWASVAHLSGEAAVLILPVPQKQGS
jgi:broad specificity phosphatase PhoE